MAGYLASPRRLILPPWAPRLPVISKSPLPVAQSLTGVAVFPPPLHYLWSRQWKGKGAGTIEKDEGRGEGETATWVL